MTHHWSSLIIKTYFKVCFRRMCSHKVFRKFVICASELYTTENNIIYDVFMYIRHVRAIIYRVFIYLKHLFTMFL